jgi:hypothetical protein
MLTSVSHALHFGGPNCTSVHFQNFQSAIITADFYEERTLYLSHEAVVGFSLSDSQVEK